MSAAIKKGVLTWTPTYRDLIRASAVRHGAPFPSDGECDFVLWEKTAFPLAPLKTIRAQVDEFFVHADFAAAGGQP